MGCWPSFGANFYQLRDMIDVVGIVFVVSSLLIFALVVYVWISSKLSRVGRMVRLQDIFEPPQVGTPCRKVDVRTLASARSADYFVIIQKCWGGTLSKAGTDQVVRCSAMLVGHSNVFSNS